MYFDKLKSKYEEYRRDPRCWIENKQRLDLSDHACKTLISDAEIFCSEQNSARGTIPSHVINHIFSCYYQSAQSSIAFTLNRLEQQISSQLDFLTSGRSRVVSVLLENEKGRLLQARDRRCREKGCPIVFRMNMENIKFLADTEEGQAEGIFYNNNIGLYVKAILEEYAEKTYSEREQIYCKAHFNEIEKAIGDKTQLRITLKGTDHSRGVERNRRMYVKPYKICQDSERMYNYLVGLISSDREGPWRIAAIRLSSMESCTKLEIPAFLSAAVRKEIGNQLNKHGVQYISSNDQNQKILVQLTPAGEKMYRRLLHLRPVCTAKYEKSVYEFECTQWQAINYFFKFGRDVKILEPQKLADSFHRRYAAAAKQYEPTEN